MKIGVLGTGVVGRALAEKLSSLGHQVYMGTRDAQTSMERTGDQAIGTWLSGHPGIMLLNFDDAAEAGEDLLVFAMNGKAAQECLSMIDETNLNGKVMIDISNPLDFSNGFPPSLTVCNTDSLGEQIQRAYPSLKVVKTLNTMSNPVMVNPGLIPGDHAVFMSGNDDGAKEFVADLLQTFGWKQQNIIDLGDISSARGTEMMLPVWVRLYGKWQTPFFNFALARG